MSNPIDIVLDATMFSTFVSCAEKYNLRFNKNKSSLEKATPLDKGDLIHKGFEPYYKSLMAKKSFEESIEAAKVGIDLAATESDLSPDEVSFLKKVMIENLHYWRNRDAYFEILAVESSFAYELHADEHIRITMIGKIDLLVNEGKYENVPIDHKTYSRDFPIKRMTDQFCNYANAMHSNYVFVNRVGLQTSLPPEKKHKREPLSYDELFLQQWKQNVIRWAYTYVECAIDDKWPMNWTSCDKFGRLCEYYDICNTSGEAGKTYKLNTNFKDTPVWDVASSLGLAK